MYTEVKELVNFLAKYLIGKLPRRPASLFICQLANFLVCRYREHKWDINEPRKDEHHRVVRSKVKGFTDQLIISAATEMGLCADEVLENLPDNILLYANPGEVFYRVGENASVVPIWSGEEGVDPDLTYCSIPSHVISTTLAEPATGSNILPAGKPFYLGRSRYIESVIDVEDAYVQLKLEPVHHSNSDDNLILPQSNLMMFTYTPKNHVPYTIKEFAATRFGSHRQRPDHDFMKRIQREAATREIDIIIESSTAVSTFDVCTSSTNSLDGDLTETKSVSTSQSVSHESSSANNTMDTTMADIEILKTLTIHQRKALVNIIRNCSMFDYSLTHLQKALSTPPLSRPKYSGRFRASINSITNSFIAPTLKEFAVPHFGANFIATMPMVEFHNTAEHHSGDVGDVL